MLETKNRILTIFLDSLGISSPSSREHYLQRCWPVVNRILNAKKKIRVLDAGCGHAHESILFAALGADVVGVELREDGYKIALQNVAKYQAIFGPLSIVLLNTNIFAAFDRLRPDVIWVRQAISHIHPAERFVQMAAQRLENDGLLVINDSNGMNPLVMIETAIEHWRGRKTFKWYVTDKYKDPITHEPVPYAVERVMSSAGMKRMLLASGFREVHADFTGYVPVFLAARLPKIALNFEASFKKIPLISKIGIEYTVVGRKVPDGLSPQR